MGVFQTDPALAASEDAYVEKPLCRTPEEARAVTASALPPLRPGDEDKPILERKSARGFGRATDLHGQNFLACVRTRQCPTTPMALGAQAALVVQLANQSLCEGRRITNTLFPQA